MVVALPKRHSAAGLQEIDLAMLKDDPFLLFPREVAPTVYDTVVDACRKAGFEPIIGQVATLAAALVKCRSSATARKYRMWRSSKVISKTDDISWYHILDQ